MPAEEHDFTGKLAGSTVLITGGTGSFGAAMARRLLSMSASGLGGPSEVRVFSRDEAKQDDMRRRFGDSRLRFYLGDVRDRDAVSRACKGVDFVFHAAALKQVPSCEFFPLEAVQTNVLGSANVIDVASRAGVRTVVCLSTDKAVYPVNAMGMTKALMEKAAEAVSRSRRSRDSVVCCVRYGNVLCSRGSVVPLFIDQIKAGVPLTLTDPDMTRFLMSLDEAVGLVERAFVSAQPGDLFVRKAPASTVGVLASAVAEIFDNDPVMKIIGTRHGEKLYETLLSREELARAEDLGEYYRVSIDGRGLDYALYFDEGSEQSREHEEYTSHNTRRLNVDEVVAILRELPEIQAERQSQLMLAGGRW